MFVVVVCVVIGVKVSYYLQLELSAIFSVTGRSQNSVVTVVRNFSWNYESILGQDYLMGL